MEKLGTELAGRVLFQCSPDHENSAFYPVASGFERLLEFTGSMSRQLRSDRLSEHLQSFGAGETGNLDFLSEFLGIDSGKMDGESDIEGPARRRERWPMF